MTLTIYGIKNCDTMKKAFAWLDKHGVAYVFHDYKKSGIDADVLKRAIASEEWENVLNRKGTTWRALPDDVKNAMTDGRALKLAAENPSVIRRPLLIKGSKMIFGFSPEDYKAFFKA